MAVIWEAGTPMKLSEIHQRLNKRREQASEPPAALSTVSTWLRSLASKGLLKEVTIGAAGQQGPPQAYSRDTRGMIPTSRSPRTGYVAAHEPGVVLQKTFKALADAYRSDQRMQALVDFARALGLSQKMVKELEKWLEDKLSP